MAEWLVSLNNVEHALAAGASGERFAEALRHGTMRLGLYAPRGEDAQEPHLQDELYVIASGSGRFVKEGEAVAFGPNDVLFVEAGAEHRFVDFTPDFAAWVVFWGPQGGEGQPAGTGVAAEGLE